MLLVVIMIVMMIVVVVMINSVMAIILLHSLIHALNGYSTSYCGGDDSNGSDNRQQAR